MTFFSRKKILIQAITFFPSFILITLAALFSFKLWNNVIASPSTPPSTPPVTSPETPPGYILGSPYPDKPSGVYYSSIRTYLNMYSGTFHIFYTTNGHDPDSFSTEFTGDPITINYSQGSIVRLKAIAYDGVGNASNISETDYVFDNSPVSADISNISNLIDKLVFSSVDTGSENPATQVNSETTFTVTNSLGTTNAVVLPEYTLITRSDGTLFEPSALTANDVNFSSISGLSNSASIEGAFQWGIVNHGLVFSKPITVIIYVGNNLNDQTLNIVRSVDGATNWTTDGIEGQSTCLVTNGYCQFQATKASYYVLARQVSSPSSNSSSNNSTSSPTDSSYCGNLPPSKSPHLFQIDVNSNTAKMYFTPLDDTSDFYISFSSKNKNAEEHGGHVTLTKEGVQSYIVYQLKPNTDYYFKIRGQNGCMPGSWSNILKIKTTSSKSINKKFYTNNVSKIVNTIQSAVKKITTNTTLKSNNKSKIILPDTSVTPTIVKKNNIPSQTTTIYPTSIPTQNNSPQNYSASTSNTSAPTSTHKKKCFLWWCW